MSESEYINSISGDQEEEFDDEINNSIGERMLKGNITSVTDKQAPEVE